MTRMRLELGICLALGGALLAGGSAVAAGPQHDLAAMALAAQDMPAGTFDEYYEWLVPTEAISEFVFGGGTPPDGLEQVYQTYYNDPTNGLGTAVVLFDFATPEQAEAGAGVMAAMFSSLPPIPDGTAVGPTSVSGPDDGGAPRTTTTVRFDAWPSGGPRVDVVATSFQLDDLVGGVSVEQWSDRPADPTAPDATPIDPDGSQGQRSAALAAAMEDRIAQVVAGISPLGADLSLPDRVLPLGEIGNGGPVFAGYKSGADLLRCGICGEENSLAGFAEVALGGYMRMVVAGPTVDGEPTPPFVLVAVSAFDTPEDALKVLGATRLAPDERPTSGPVPRGRRMLVDDPEIPGADVALAFVASMDGNDPASDADSASVDLVVGHQLVTIDVLGGLGSQEALAVAIDLATQQTACLASPEPCELEVPTALATLATRS